MNLSPLQQEFLDVLLDDPDLCSSVESDESWNGIITDIKRMNAAELRQNIKAFKETNQ